jgi:predicted O-linked N-acetylglucosamine transferase (SPINDLY family)
VSLAIKKARVRALLDARRFEDARATCRSLTQAHADDAESWLLLAIAQAELGQLSDAANACEHAVRLRPAYTDARLTLGRLRSRAGDFAAAAAELKQVLNAQPGNVTALTGLANALIELRRFAEAEDICRRLVGRMPDDAPAHNLLGRALREQGQLAAAESAYRRALALRPSYAVAMHNLGDVLLEQGRVAESLAEFDKCLRLVPSSETTLLRHGDAASRAGGTEEMWRSYVQALQLAPSLLAELVRRGDDRFSGRDWEGALAFFTRLASIAPTDVSVGLRVGQALCHLDRHDEAIGQFHRLIEVFPGCADAHNDLAVALIARGRLDEALVCLEKALALRPDYAEAHNNLTTLYMKREEWDNAAANCARALALRADYMEAVANMANIHSLRGRHDESLPWFERALALAPESASIHNSYGIVLQQLGDVDAAVAHFREVSRCDSRNPDGPQNITFMVNYLENLTPDEVFAQHRKWAERYESAAARARRHPNDRDPDRRLRVGYVSPDLRGHSVACFFEPLLAAHDRVSVEIFCYSDAKKPDAVTARLRDQAAHWRETRAMTHEEFAALVTADRIDILVDLAGHTDDNRLVDFARRPAPVQVTYLGYCNTTGLHEMDYRLTDAWADPPGATERWHTETLVRLPRGFLCYRPEDDAPPVGPLPALGNGYVTFGSFNNIMKLSPGTIRVWAAILAAVPDSKLVLKNRLMRQARARDRIVGAFVDAGIDSARLVIGGFLEKRDHLDVYNQVDIALDPFPYNGTTTTCESLWMGVPVIALAGRVHAGRVGASILSAVGLDGWIAADKNAYVAIAVRAAADLDALGALRASLRDRMAVSPLCDAVRLAREIETAYRAMWRTWCSSALS